MIQISALIAAIPTLICAIALCFTDILYFVVPRAWVIFAIILQTLSTSIYSILLKHDFSITFLGWISSAICCCLYVIMRYIAGKKSLGFGDITCAIMLAQALILFGFESIITWIALTGVIGIFAIIICNIHQKFHARFHIKSSETQDAINSAEFNKNYQNFRENNASMNNANYHTNASTNTRTNTNSHASTNTNTISIRESNYKTRIAFVPVEVLSAIIAIAIYLA